MEDLLSCKTILLGKYNVGKTEIIARVTQSAKGASYARKTIKVGNNKVSFEIWDTAGQEKYRALTKIFYEDVNVALLVYDITNRISFDEIKNYWYNQVMEYANSKPIFVVVANNIESIENEQVNEDEAKEFANSINGIFAKVSSASNFGIEALFENIARKVLDSNIGNKAEKREKEDYINHKKDNYDKNEYEKKINELNEKLNKANKIIEKQKIEIQDLKNKIDSFPKIDNNLINNLNNDIMNKNNQINQLQKQIENITLNNNRNDPKNFIYKGDMRCVNFMSTDQSLFYAITCSGTDIFAEVEEKLYKEYPEYRETNNTFLANGTEILRFKSINDNKIGNGKPIILVKPS